MLNCKTLRCLVIILNPLLLLYCVIHGNKTIFIVIVIVIVIACLHQVDLIVRTDLDKYPAYLHQIELIVRTDLDKYQAFITPRMNW